LQDWLTPALFEATLSWPDIGLCNPIIVQVLVAREGPPVALEDLLGITLVT
jgi:hypothetical protein